MRLSLAFLARRSLPAIVALVAACTTTSARPPSLTTERIAAIVASPDRSAADRENDMRRKPVDMLAFIGVRPGMQVLDVSAGGGYTTELLARAVGPDGRVYGQSPPANAMRQRPAMPEGGAGMDRPAAAPRTSAMRVADRAQNAHLANMMPLVAPFERPGGNEIAPGSLDLVTLMFNYHDMGHLGVDRAAMNASIFAR